MTDRVRRGDRSWPLLWTACWLAGCGTALPNGQRDPNGSPCFDYRRNHAPQRMCTSLPLTPSGTAVRATGALPTEDASQVLVHWVDRAGATRPLVLSVDGRVVAELLPASMVSLRLRPGPHVLAVAWDAQQAIATIDVEAGSSYVYEIKGWVRLFAWGFEWIVDNSLDAQKRASAAFLIANVDLRQSDPPWAEGIK